MNAKRALDFLPQSPYTTRPKSNNGKFIFRAKAAVDSANGMGPAQLDFLEKNADERERNIRSNSTITMDVVTDFVDSFEHTIFKDTKGGNNSMAIPYELFKSTSSTVVQFWTHPAKKWIHVPVVVGKGRISHFISVAVSKNQRKIFVYNSGRRYSRQNKDDIVLELDNNTFDKGKTSHERGDYMKMVGIESIRNICDEVLKLESLAGTNPFNFPWNIRIVNTFFFQQNSVDCGIFACYFF